MAQRGKIFNTINKYSFSGPTGIENLPSETIRDYLLLILFTGLRREEAATLHWQDVDLEELTLTIPDPKNSEPHVLPLSDYLAAMLQRRHDESTSDFVFPSKTSQSGHLVNPWKVIRAVTRDTGITFSVHDLRRTFITTAESLDISVYALKRLLNHKMRQDVTAGYIVTDVHRLTEPMQRITDHILSCAGQGPRP